MLALQQALEAQYSIINYLKATFSFREQDVYKAFYDYILADATGIFKGPYTRLQLPFVRAKEGETIPLEIAPSFSPFSHQLQAFKRLHTDGTSRNNREGGHQPEPTILTTGTGSGKTESFMFPLLDYCHKNQHRNGIKAIILYPMNALATDQAKRLAETIWADHRLKGKVTVGLFIGEGKDKKKYPTTMGENHVIEQRDMIVDSPPDILLTNFKMLDYGLMQSRFHNLWTHNFEDTDLLKFLVLDELHTYDGAQGTDVANLIRRLKLKLNLKRGDLCPVGTSATMGSGAEAPRLLSEYATTVFGEDFDASCIITENRETPEVFFGNTEVDDFFPRLAKLRSTRLKIDENYAIYVKKQRILWQLDDNTDAVQLGLELKKLKIVRQLVALAENKYVTLKELSERLSAVNDDFKRLPQLDTYGTSRDNREGGFNPKEEVIISLFALIAEAKLSAKLPFMYVQVQLWVRELSGILRELSETPRFTWKSDIKTEEETKAFPAYFCRDCGASGWLMVKHDNKERFENEINDVYEKFFKKHKHIFLVNTKTEAHEAFEEYKANEMRDSFVNTKNLTIFEKKRTNTFPVYAYQKMVDGKNRHICPECNADNTISIIGTRTATLSSVTVSQVLASDLDAAHEQGRKVLAFTNSVQDAAHQAGFVEARNYRFAFRSSLQKVINRQTEPISLSDLQETFIKYWREYADPTGQKQVAAYYFRFFPSDYIGEVDLKTDYRVKNSLDFTDDFSKEFDHRMRWEVAAEYGYNALIGRTLEKNKASAAYFEGEILRGVFGRMSEWLAANNLAVIKEGDFTLFLNTLLHRVRTRGAISHAYLKKFRTEELKLWDLNWNKDNRHFLNKKFGKNSRFPKLLAFKPDFGGVLDTAYTLRQNWYHTYFVKNFDWGNTQVINEFYEQLFKHLTELAILDVATAHGVDNFALQPQSIKIQKQVKTLACTACGARLFVGQNDKYTEGGKCLSYRCLGEYALQISDETEADSYYSLVYNRTRSPRIYAAEHTGMLERKDREQKELDFKTRPQHNSLNVMVATSTLEMGIDIGTLNTVINNSVPPLPSNFMQRVGRAGRSSGAALVINFSGNKSHDLFYYGEPKDMMQGDVSTPGCYLDAKEILYRHFFAYCIDNWTASDPKQNAIPPLVRLLNLYSGTTDVTAPQFFINRILNYIKAHEKHLLDRYTAFYAQEVSPSVLDGLRAVLANESFYRRQIDVFHRLKEEMAYLKTKRQEIDDYIKQKNLGKTDTERQELEDEKRSLWRLIKTIEKRSVIEHITNQGLLPNYAFPETGVTLTGRIYRSFAKESTQAPKHQELELVRPAQTALRELAPDNFFYSQGNKLFVNGINTYDWKEGSVLMEKRFCSNCDHLEDAATANPNTVCPKCESETWRSPANLHRFVRFTAAKSLIDRKDAYLDDSKDERDKIIYATSRHFSFDKKTFHGAWGMRGIPFGIEFVGSIEVTDINLGQKGVADARKTTINQRDVPMHGFVTCRHCGKSTANPNQNAKLKDYKFHYVFCKHKAHDYKGKPDAVFEEVFLYRTLKTEGLKILLPIQEWDSEANILMFKAGLNLGLRKYYKGNPQHIAISEYAEYNPKNNRFDQYLIFYDTIPGGTGYLEKLFDKDNFSTLLKFSYEAIKDCSCQNEGKDGCYRCILSYGNQYHHEDLSRQKAEKLFEQIVQNSQAWEKLSASLGSLTNNGRIEESELEERFLRSLRLKGRNAEGGDWREFIENGVVNYELTLSEGDSKLVYVIRPQVYLGAGQGVRLPTRADFVMTCCEAKIGHKQFSGEELLTIKETAIYLDGYQYHATTANMMFENDVKRRAAINESGRLTTWTLTWRDLELFDNTMQEDETTKRDTSDSFHTKKAKNFKINLDITRKLLKQPSLNSAFFDAQNNLERLLWRLLNPLKTEDFKLGFLLFQNQFAKPSFSAADTEGYLQFRKAIDFSQIYKSPDAFVVSQIAASNSVFDARLFLRLKDLLPQFGLFLTIPKMEDLTRQDWEDFWRLYNLVQMEQPKIMFSTDVIENEDSEGKNGDDLADVLVYYDAEYHPIVQLLIEKQVEFAKEGSFFLMQGDKQIAESVLGFEDKKIAVGALSEKDKTVFEQQGYTVFTYDDFDINHIVDVRC